MCLSLVLDRSADVLVENIPRQVTPQLRDPHRSAHSQFGKAPVDEVEPDLRLSRRSDTRPSPAPMVAQLPSPRLPGFSLICRSICPARPVGASPRTDEGVDRDHEVAYSQERGQLHHCLEVAGHLHPAGRDRRLGERTAMAVGASAWTAFVTGLRTWIGAVSAAEVGRQWIPGGVPPQTYAIRWRRGRSALHGAASRDAGDSETHAALPSPGAPPSPWRPAMTVGHRSGAPPMLSPASA